MTAILLALGSSVGYGVSDFLASRVAKRVAPVLLVLYSQALQSVVLLVVVLAVSQPYSGPGLAWGTAAGAVGAAGLVAYYHALATGQTAIVAPLASSGAVLPLLVDLGRGELPGPLAMAGLVMVLAGIAVTSFASEDRDDQAPAPTWHGPPATWRRVAVPRPPVPILLALVAAAFFGLFFSVSTWAAGPPGRASSGSRSGSSSAPCPPPWPGRCGPEAGGASASMTRPCCCRWRSSRCSTCPPTPSWPTRSPGVTWPWWPSSPPWPRWSPPSSRTP
jgi:drug/metabolite transporter (DMT)-like permease